MRIPPLQVFAKSPTQMRREAEEHENPKARNPRPVKRPEIDPEKRPPLDGASFSAWLRTGQIEGR